MGMTNPRLSGHEMMLRNMTYCELEAEERRMLYVAGKATYPATRQSYYGTLVLIAKEQERRCQPSYGGQPVMCAPRRLRAE